MVMAAARMALLWAFVVIKPHHSIMISVSIAMLFSFWKFLLHHESC